MHVLMHDENVVCTLKNTFIHFISEAESSPPKRQRSQSSPPRTTCVSTDSPEIEQALLCEPIIKASVSETIKNNHDSITPAQQVQWHGRRYSRASSRLAQHIPIPSVMQFSLPLPEKPGLKLHSGAGKASPQQPTQRLPQKPPGVLLPVAEDSSNDGAVDHTTAVVKPLVPLSAEQCSDCLDMTMVIPPQSSVGSLGHPFTCASPCKYVGRKKGCRDGQNCSDCHLCRWTRRTATLSASDRVDEELQRLAALGGSCSTLRI